MSIRAIRVSQIALACCRSALYEAAVLWNVLLGILAGLSAALGLWQWVAAWRFPLHKRLPAAEPLPEFTILKPLKGCDEFTEKCLRSWLRQDYAAPFQLLFGVTSEHDPAGDVVRRLLGELPHADAALVICPEKLGANAKVSTLIQLQRQAKHDIIVVSDADVRVPQDLIANAVQPLVEQFNEAEGCGSSSGLCAAENGSPNGDGGRGRGTRTGVATGKVGLVSCPYRLANPSTLAMQWEAIAINADFWSQVLQSNTLKPMDFALGAVVIVRREALEAIGGFETLVDCLADDYQLGNRVVRKGYRAKLCPVVVECWDPPQGWEAVWKHQLRWARTIRVCQPVPYFFSILSNATLWPLLWLAVVPSGLSLIGAGALMLLRILIALRLQARLSPDVSPMKTFWLVPLKDLLGAVTWLGAFLGNTVEWRGQRTRLRRDGTMRAC